jgi:hypothetical protein
LTGYEANFKPRFNTLKQPLNPDETNCLKLAAQKAYIHTTLNLSPKIAKESRMPQFLRDDSVRMLEGAKEALHLALAGLGLPCRHEFREHTARYSSILGLLGVAVEQTMSACLIQVWGSEQLQKSNSTYKSGREILAEFRSLLRAPVARGSFLTSGVADPQAHRDTLLQATDAFGILITGRAAGLHAAIGPTREVAVFTARRVYDFLFLMSKSNRVRPYLNALPEPTETMVVANVLVEDLAQRLRAARNPVDKAALIGNLFLILPELPTNEPAWIDAFDRVMVSPAETDIALLMTTLEDAVPVQLQRVKDGGTPISVVIRPDDPNAIAVAPHHLRRSFIQIADQWAADVGNANGRLETGSLDLPPYDFVLDLFVLGPDNIKNALNRKSFTAHDIWPFIATSLTRPGTPGPYWFLLRMCDDLGQLESQLTRSLNKPKPAFVKERLKEVCAGLRCIDESKHLPYEASLIKECSACLEKVRSGRDKLKTRLSSPEGNRSRMPSEEYLPLLQAVAEGGSISQVLEALLDNGLGLKAEDDKKYWARITAELASDPQDGRTLVRIIHSQFNQAQTAARKALRLIDAITFGPPMEIADA